MSTRLLRAAVRCILAESGTSRGAWISPDGRVLPVEWGDEHAHVAAAEMGASFNEDADDLDAFNTAYVSQGAVQVRTWPRWDASGGFTSFVATSLTPGALRRIADWLAAAGLSPRERVSINTTSPRGEVRATVGDVLAARGPRDLF